MNENNKDIKNLNDQIYLLKTKITEMETALEESNVSSFYYF